MGEWMDEWLGGVSEKSNDNAMQREKHAVVVAENLDVIDNIVRTLRLS